MSGIFKETMSSETKCTIDAKDSEFIETAMSSGEVYASALAHPDAGPSCGGKKPKAKAKAAAQLTDEEKEMQKVKASLGSTDSNMSQDIQGTMILLSKAKAASENKPWVVPLIEQVSKSVEQLQQEQQTLRQSLGQGLAVEDMKTVSKKADITLKMFKGGYKKDLARLLR